MPGSGPRFVNGLAAAGFVESAFGVVAGAVFDAVGLIGKAQGDGFDGVTGLGATKSPTVGA